MSNLEIGIYIIGAFIIGGAWGYFLGYDSGFTNALEEIYEKIKSLKGK